MIIREAVLDRVCGITSRLPDNDLPEIVFAGKSNVGKSSLINSLVQRKSLARISSEPGKTRTINYYKVNGSFFLVDLPGYGYAKISLEEKEKWGRMIENYLDSSRQIKAVFLLIDIRHEPGANDISMYEWILSRGFRPVIVLTKADKLKKSRIEAAVKVIRDAMKLPEDAVIIRYSSESGLGREDLTEYIESVID